MIKVRKLHFDYTYLFSHLWVHFAETNDTLRHYSLLRIKLSLIGVNSNLLSVSGFSQQTNPFYLDVEKSMTTLRVELRF